MVLIIFLLAIAVTVYSAIKISTYADAISRMTSFGSMLIGTFLLATATSLPEVTTSVTAVFIDNPDMAVGNVIGSNLFNLVILTAFILIYKNKPVLSSVNKTQKHIAIYGVFMTLVIAVALF